MTSTVFQSGTVIDSVWLNDVNAKTYADPVPIALAASSGSSLVGYLPDGVGTTPSTVQDKLREIVSIKDFGAVADATGVSGVGTDNTAAIQRALNHVNSVGGGVVVIPPGWYRKADTGGTLIMYSNTTLRGEGECSTIFFDDTVINPRQDFLRADNTTNVNFENFRVSGTAWIYPNDTNNSQLFGGLNIDGLRMTRVTIEKVRFMATAFAGVDGGMFSGNRLNYIIRDGIRCTGSRNIAVIGNILTNVSDDCINLHALDADAIPGTGFIIANNILDRCQGIKVLGAKILSVTGNVIKMSLRGPINIYTPDTGPEGTTPTIEINISNNIITDTFGDLGGNNCIFVGSALASNNTVPQPGTSSSPYPYTYANNLDAGGVNVGALGITISNNTISRTLPDNVQYSSYGLGDRFDWATPGLWSDPFISSTSYSVHGIQVMAPMNGALIQGNRINGMGAGFNALWVSLSGAVNLAYANTTISNNVITDCPGIGLSISATSVLGGLVIVKNNSFDLDPYFRSVTHNSDNTWTSSGNVVGISNSASLACLITEGNIFSHMGSVVLNPLSGAKMRANNDIVICEPTGYGDLAGNKGVRKIDQNMGYTYVIYNGDPTSTSFKNITTFPVTISNALPTTGFYLAGFVIKADSATVVGTGGSKYIVSGWTRLTTGSAHVLNTDWAEMRTLTGT